MRLNTALMAFLALGFPWTGCAPGEEDLTPMQVGSCGACRGNPACPLDEPMVAEACSSGGENLNCFYCVADEQFAQAGARWACSVNTDYLWERDDNAYECVQGL